MKAVYFRVGLFLMATVFFSCNANAAFFAALSCDKLKLNLESDPSVWTPVEAESSPEEFNYMYVTEVTLRDGTKYEGLIKKQNEKSIHVTPWFGKGDGFHGCQFHDDQISKVKYIGRESWKGENGIEDMAAFKVTLNNGEFLTTYTYNDGKMDHPFRFARAEWGNKALFLDVKGNEVTFNFNDISTLISTKSPITSTYKTAFRNKLDENKVKAEANASAVRVEQERQEAVAAAVRMEQMRQEVEDRKRFDAYNAEHAPIIAEAKRVQEARAEEQGRRDAEAKRVQEARAEEQGRRDAEAKRVQVDAFRKIIKIGDDSHCGLVIEVKKPIVKVQTMAGEKWIKLTQIYPTGTASCRFVNGVYQEVY